MTQRLITVAIGSDLVEVGTLHYEERGNRQHTAFKYSDSWLANESSFALAPSLALSSSAYYTSGSDRTVFPGPISDCTPDAWGRAVISNASHIRVNELDILLAVNDFTRMGALRFIDENGELKSTMDHSVPSITELENIRETSAAFERDSENRVAIARRLRGSGDSLGGARPKSDVNDEGHLSIAKFTSATDTRPVEQMEVTALELARRVGIRTPQARVVLMNQPFPVAIIRRFDRAGERRIPYVSARSFLGVDDANGDAYYTDIADTMRSACGNEAEARTELRELFQRIVFYILISNTDDHLKNHGFLLTGRNKWMLAPIFDVNPQPERQMQLKTGISEISGSQASIEAAIEAAPFFDLDEDQSSKLVSRMASTIYTHWKHISMQNGLSESQCRSYSPAFEHDEMDYAMRLARSSHSVPFRR